MAVCVVWMLAAPLARARNVALVGNLRDGTVTVIDEHSLKVLGSINVTPDGKTPQDPAQAAIYPFLVRTKGVNYVQGLALSPAEGSAGPGRLPGTEATPDAPIV